MTDFWQTDSKLGLTKRATYGVRGVRQYTGGNCRCTDCQSQILRSYPTSYGSSQWSHCRRTFQLLNPFQSRPKKTLKIISPRVCAVFSNILLDWLYLCTFMPSIGPFMSYFWPSFNSSTSEFSFLYIMELCSSKLDHKFPCSLSHLSPVFFRPLESLLGISGYYCTIWWPLVAR